MKAIGIVRYWPDQHVAEHENIGRFRQACANIGYSLVELTPDGYRVDTGQRLRTGDCELVLNLHFAAPKCYDAPSLAALWNPLDYYRGFGFASSLTNQFSHDFFAQTGSRTTERLLAELRPDYTGPAIQLNHSVPGPLEAPPDRSDFKFFYVGVDWERINGGVGRHTALLTALDEADALHLYGPEALPNGIEPWKGFRGYLGSLPFDGSSVINAAREAGIYLALSSDSHVRDGIMSNRLFEGVAAGCVIVSNRHDFVERTLGELAYYVDTDTDSQSTADELLKLRDQLVADPQAARERARACQEILEDGLLLDQQLDRAIRVTAATARDREPETRVDIACALLPGCLRTPEEFASWLIDSPGLHAFSKIAVFTANKELADHVDRFASSGRDPHLQLVRIPARATSLDSPDLVHAVGEWARESMDEWLVFATGNEYIYSDFAAKTAAVVRPESRVVHHSSVRPAHRAAMNEQLPNPSLSVPGETVLWTRALSSFVVRRVAVADWIANHLDTGLLALMMALDAELHAAEHADTAAVVPVPTVAVPRKPGMGEVLGDLWAADSPEALEAVFLRRRRKLFTRGRSVEAASVWRSWSDELTLAGHGELRSMQALRSVQPDALALPSVDNAGLLTATPHDLVLRFRSLSPEQRLYILQMMLDEVPRSFWRRVYLKLFRARRRLPTQAVPDSQ